MEKCVNARLTYSKAMQFFFFLYVCAWTFSIIILLYIKCCLLLQFNCLRVLIKSWKTKRSHVLAILCLCLYCSLTFHFSNVLWRPGLLWKMLVELNLFIMHTLKMIYISLDNKQIISVTMWVIHISN